MVALPIEEPGLSAWLPATPPTVSLAPPMTTSPAKLSLTFRETTLFSPITNAEPATPPTAPIPAIVSSSWVLMLLMLRRPVATSNACAIPLIAVWNTAPCNADFAIPTNSRLKILEIVIRAAVANAGAAAALAPPVTGANTVAVSSDLANQATIRIVMYLACSACSAASSVPAAKPRAAFAAVGMNAVSLTATVVR